MFEGDRLGEVFITLVVVELVLIVEEGCSIDMLSSNVEVTDEVVVGGGIEMNKEKVEEGISSLDKVSKSSIQWNNV